MSEDDMSFIAPDDLPDGPLVCDAGWKLIRDDDGWREPCTDMATNAVWLEDVRAWLCLCGPHFTFMTQTMDAAGASLLVAPVRQARA